MKMMMMMMVVMMMMMTTVLFFMGLLNHHEAVVEDQHEAPRQSVSLRERIADLREKAGLLAAGLGLSV